MSEGLMVVYVRDGKATYSFRGTEEWIGPDGLANVTNPSGFNILAQALNEATGVDFRPEQQRTIERVLAAGVEEYGTQKHTTVTLAAEQKPRLRDCDMVEASLLCLTLRQEEVSCDKVKASENMQQRQILYLQ